MSLKARLDEARVLWDAGHKEGAFILIAMAATSRRKYPKPNKPKEQRKPKAQRKPESLDLNSDAAVFKRFLADEMQTITGGPKYGVVFPFRGEERVRLVDILYHHLRCQLVHEGEMPSTIVFTPPVFKDGKFYDVLKLQNPLGFPEGWIWNLAKVVTTAPENSEDFQVTTGEIAKTRDVLEGRGITKPSPSKTVAKGKSSGKSKRRTR
jgi:hypothetical protein